MTAAGRGVRGIQPEENNDCNKLCTVILRKHQEHKNSLITDSLLVYISVQLLASITVGVGMHRTTQWPWLFCDIDQYFSLHGCKQVASYTHSLENALATHTVSTPVCTIPP